MCRRVPDGQRQLVRPRPQCTTGTPRGESVRRVGPLSHRAQRAHRREGCRSSSPDRAVKYPADVTVMAQCWRETSGSVKVRSHPGARPIVTTPRGNGAMSPASGPPTTCMRSTAPVARSRSPGPSTSITSPVRNPGPPSKAVDGNRRDPCQSSGFPSARARQHRGHCIGDLGKRGAHGSAERDVAAVAVCVAYREPNLHGASLSEHRAESVKRNPICG